MAIEKLTVQRCNRFINDCRKQKKTKILNDGGGLYIRATAGGTASREACLAHATGNAVSNAYARGDLFARRREVMERWSAFVTRPIGGNVTALQRTAS